MSADDSPTPSLALHGRVIVSTRPAPDAGRDRLHEALAASGAVVLALPLTEVRLRAWTGPRPALDTVAACDWVVFTSANGVRGLLGLLDGATWPSSARAACVGKATAAALEARGVACAFRPSTASAAALGAELGPLLAPGSRVLLALGNLAPDDLASALAPRARVERADVYDTVPLPFPASAARGRLASRDYDLVLFCSGSAVDAYFAGPGAPPDPAPRAACLGTSAAAALHRRGVEPILTASAPEPGALARDLARFFSGPKGTT